MASFSRIEVALRMREIGVVPVFYDPDVEACVDVAEACYRGGATVFELTNRGDGAHDVFAGLARELRSRHPDLILGIGSVVDAPTAALYLQLGADFVVSPVLNPEVGRLCNRRKVLWLPGCGTLSEISAAEELGAEIVKIFPGSEVGGPSFVKAVRGPCPWTSIMPTGGVEPTETSLRDWFEAGVWCVGIGSKLIAKGEGGGYDVDGIEQRVRSALAAATRVRGG